MFEPKVIPVGLYQYLLPCYHILSRGVQILRLLVTETVYFPSRQVYKDAAWSVQVSTRVMHGKKIKYLDGDAEILTLSGLYR